MPLIVIHEQRDGLRGLSKIQTDLSAHQASENSYSMSEHS